MIPLLGASLDAVMATVGEVVSHDKGDRRDPKSHPRKSAMRNKEVPKGTVFLAARALMLRAIRLPSYNGGRRAGENAK